MSKIFNTWLNLLFRHLSSINFWPSRETVQKYMPKEFLRSGRYGNTRIILDATELFIEKPSDLSLQSVTWSNYKSHNTLKGLIGICPFGGITFVSSLWAGSVSDVELTQKSGLLDLLEEGDNVMADKGFKIEEELRKRGITLNIPPFMLNGRFSEHELQVTKEIASLRIHVERAIERVKNFRILSGTISCSIPAATVNKFFYVCAMLTNLEGYLVRPHAKATLQQPLQDVTSSKQACDQTVEKGLSVQSNQSEAPKHIIHCQESQPYDEAARIKQMLSVTPEIQKTLEQRTKQQRKCSLWFQLRKHRLTSSNFGKIAKRKSRFDQLVIQLLHQKHYSVPSLKWGQDHEEVALRQYTEKVHKISPNLHVIQSGLWIGVG